MENKSVPTESCGAKKGVFAFLNRPRFKHGALAGVLVILVILAVVGLNVLLEVLDSRVNLDVDLTSNKIYEISGVSRELMKKLEKDVTLTVIQPEAQFDPYTSAALNNYARLSPRITFRVVDVTLNPTFANQFPEGALTASSIIVQCGDRYKILDESDLYVTQQQQYYYYTYEQRIGLRAEQKLTGAILAVTADETPIAYYTTGHGEMLESASALLELCADNNLTVQPINLASEDPDLALGRLLIVLEPQSDFSAPELAKLDAFLESGDKNVLMFLDGRIDSIPTLSDYLTEWGIRLNREIVLEPASYWSGQPTYLLAEYGDSDMTAALRARGVNVVAPISRSMDAVSTRRMSLTPFTILTSTADAYARSFDAESSSPAQTAEDRTGPFNLALGVTYQTILDQTRFAESNLMVFGSYGIAVNSLLGSTALGNQELLTAAMLYGNPEADAVSVRPILFTDTSLNMSRGQISAVNLVFTWLIPLAALGIGLFVFIRRKNR